MILMSISLPILTAPEVSAQTQVISEAGLNWISILDKDFNLHYTPADTGLTETLKNLVRSGMHSIGLFFGESFKKSFSVFLFPDRKSLDRQWRKDWNLPEFASECWMVASGVGHRLDVLSPRVWNLEACDHNPNDTVELRRLLTHELVHVFHGQHNRIPTFEGLDDIGWFIEGLATYASGQLDSLRMAQVRDLIRQDKAPTRLKDAWTGKYKYAIAGSLIRYIDQKYGRRILKDLLKCTNQNQILKTLKISETGLLAEWKDSISSGK